MTGKVRLGGARLAQLWESLRTSYWFVPALMTTGAIGLSVLSVHLDGRVKTGWIQKVAGIWTGSPEGAREVLSTIAGSMITIVGVVFSITIVALTLASSQFGPRLLRSFMRDLGNQVVLGTFVSTFVYCLLVLRTVRGAEGAKFVPDLSVTLGIVFALASVGVLIYFIHHVSSSIQAEYLIAAVARELDAAIEHMFPEELGEPATEARAAPDERSAEIEAEGAVVEADQSGYVQTIDDEELMATACEEGLVLELLRLPGHFLIAGTALARVWPPERVDDEVAGRIRRAYLLGRRRTPTQDPEHAVHQLVEIAVRALSPGINDPFTTMSCLDWLGVALSRLARSKIPSPCRYDDRGRLRVIADGTDFPAMADAAFNQIRQYGRGSVSVLLRLLDTIAAVGENVRRAEDRACLRRHADKVAADAREALSNELDLREVEERHAATARALFEPSAAPN